MPCPMVQVRLLDDTRHGGRGECVYLPIEYVEALVGDHKAVVIDNKSMTRGKATRKNGMPIKPIGGTERKGAD